MSPRLSGVADDEPVAPLSRKIVWMIVDAMRADFVQYLDIHYHGVAFDCLSPSPTITLPRLFALVTGSEPSFSRALTNFGGKAALEDDSIVLQWRRSNKTIVFYGDDTWLRLFPPDGNFFSRFEGVSSFDVRDSEQVDENVTRNVRAELRDSSAFDVMILHFLGVDHIGHSLGPQHEKMRQKIQHQMSRVIDEICSDVSMKQSDGVVVISGDHGMTSEGNHGGNSAQETSTLQAVIRCRHKMEVKKTLALESGIVCHQADVTATLAEISGVSAPLNCLGIPLEKALDLMHSAGDQMLRSRRVKRRLDRFARGVGVDDQQQHSKCGDDLQCRAHQLRMLGSSDLVCLVMGLMGLLLSFTCLISNTHIPTQSVENGFRMAFCCVVLAYFQETRWTLWILSLYASVTIRHTLFMSGFKSVVDVLKIAVLELGWIRVLFSAVWLLLPLSSSFAEEAYLPLHFMLQTSLLMLCVVVDDDDGSSSRRRNVFLLALVASLRHLNPSGDKWRHLVPICHLIPAPYTSIVSAILPLVPLLVLASFSKKRLFLLCFGFLCLTSCLFIATSYHSLVYIIIPLCISLYLLGDRSTLFFVSCIISQIIHASNSMCSALAITIGFLCIYIISSSSSSSSLSVSLWNLIILESVLFHSALGYSLSISSVALSGAYVFTTSYQPIVVFITGAIMICGPSWMTATSQHNNPTTTTHQWSLSCWTVLKCFVACSVAFAQRKHLFVWSVFGPVVVWEFVRLLQTLVLYF